MKIRQLILLAALLATASFASTGTLAVLPDAEALPAGMTEVSVAAWQTQDSATGVADSFPLAVRHNLYGNVEVGITRFQQRDFEAWGGAARVLLTPAGKFPAVSAGAVIADHASADVRHTQGWVAITDSFRISDSAENPQIRLTLGANYTDERDTAALTGGVNTAYRAFAGAEVDITPRLRLLLEAQSKANALDKQPLTSAMLRWQFTPACSADLGYTNAIGEANGGEKQHAALVVRWCRR